MGQLSEQSLAAAAITGVYYLIFAAIGFGLNNGLQALISRRAGENRPGEIGKLFIHGVGISMGVASDRNFTNLYHIALDIAVQHS